MIGRFELVRLEMSVNERVWVIGVGLVQVLPRHRRGTDEPGHKGTSNAGASGPADTIQIWSRTRSLTQKSGSGRAYIDNMPI